MSTPLIVKVEDESAEKITNTDNDENQLLGKRTTKVFDNSAPSTSQATAVVATKRRKVKPSEDPSAASVLKEFFLQTKYESDNIYRSITQDPLSNFFLLMVQTVSTFPLRDQVDIKESLFQMVTYIEKSIANTYSNDPRPESDNMLKTVNQDRLTNFFLTMAETVSSFHVRDQVEIKGNLFQVVNAVEMRLANTLAPSDRDSNNLRPPAEQAGHAPPPEQAAHDHRQSGTYYPYPYPYFYPYPYAGYDYTKNGS